MNLQRRRALSSALANLDEVIVAVDRAAETLETLSSDGGWSAHSGLTVASEAHLTASTAGAEGVQTEVLAVRDEEQAAYSNLPEAFQGALLGERLQDAIDRLSDAEDDFDEAASSFREAEQILRDLTAATASCPRSDHDGGLVFGGDEDRKEAILDLFDELAGLIRSAASALQAAHENVQRAIDI